MSPCEDIIYNSLDYGTSQSWIMSGLVYASGSGSGVLLYH